MQYKAALAKALLAAIDSFDRADRGEIFERAGNAHVVAIRDAPRTAWIAAAHQLAVDEALAAMLGDDALEQQLRDYVSRAAQTPLFAPILRGALAMFGVSPSSLYRFLPRAWDMTSRNAGSIVERSLGDHAHEIRYEDLPPVMRVSCLAVATRGSSLGILDLVNRKGTAETDVSALADGVLVHRISWAPLE